MTNQQFDAMVRTFINLLDLHSDDPKTLRAVVLDMFIDEKTRKKHEQPLMKQPAKK